MFSSLQNCSYHPHPFHFQRNKKLHLWDFYSPKEKKNFSEKYFSDEWIKFDIHQTFSLPSIPRAWKIVFLFQTITESYKKVKNIPSDAFWIPRRMFPLWISKYDKMMILLRFPCIKCFQWESEIPSELLSEIREIRFVKLKSEVRWRRRSLPSRHYSSYILRLPSCSVN